MPFGTNLRPLPKSLYNGRTVGLAFRLFSAISVRFSTTQSIFPIARDPKLTADALGLRCRAAKTNLCTPVLMPFGSNMRPLLNLYTMAEGLALRLAGFRPFLSAFPQLIAYFPLRGTLN